MDDLTFRRIAVADPECCDKDFITKKEANQSNQDFADAQKIFNHQLKNAMNIDIPDGLKERILLNHALNDEIHKVNLFKMFLPMAMVASLFLAVVLFFNLTPSVMPVLGQSVLSHIYQEKNSLLTDKSIAKKQVDNLLSHFGAKINLTFGKIVHATLCDVQNKQSIHLVFEKNQQRVILILSPIASSSDQMAFADQRFKGMIVPSAKGSMVIVSEDIKITKQLIQQFKTSIRWS